MLKSLSFGSHRKHGLLLVFWLLTAAPVFAQTTGFTYQGRLTDGGSPANGLYDLQFTLFDMLIGGAQQGSPQTKSNVQVTSGIFTVQLDFGTTVFTSNAGKFLEIGVRNAGVGGFTTLPQRQPVTSTPYAIQTLNASQLGGVAANQYVQTTDARLSDARTPTGTASGDLTGSYPNPTIANNAVTSAKIAADTIVNTDISPSAAIANTKIAGLGSLATVTPTGTADNTTFLRGDNTWSPVAAGAGTAVFAARTTSLTVNSATFVDVITVNLEANKTYFFEGAVYGVRVGATSGNANMRVTYTGTATTDIGIDVISATLLGTVFNSTSFDFEALANGSTNGFGANVTKEFPTSGYIKTTSAGTLALKIARGAANTTVDLTVREGTYLRASPMN